MAEVENRPLSYINWVQTVDPTVTSEADLFKKYNTYVTDWYVEAGLVSNNNQQGIINLYSDLLREITINYTSLEEKRFLSNVDFDDF